MHPLETNIDVSLHKGHSLEGKRRRRSLDNSCLGSSDTFEALLAEELRYVSNSPSRRRLSLNLADNLTTITFLAAPTSLTTTTKKDLDDSFHGVSPRRFRPLTTTTTTATAAMRNHSLKYSVHSATSAQDSFQASLHEIKPPNGGTTTTTRQTSSSSHESSWSSSGGSDGEDSFCDASLEEAADRAYLRSDLGASVMWSDDSGGNLDYNDDSGDDDQSVDRSHLLVAAVDKLPPRQVVRRGGRRPTVPRTHSSESSIGGSGALPVPEEEA